MDIQFPAASDTSKLSANPTTKIPQATDWIFQDFFTTMLEYNNNHKSLAMPDIFTYDPIERSHLLFVPVLIEEDSSVPSTIADNDSSIHQESTIADNNSSIHQSSTVDNNRKSNMSFSSLKSLLSAFNTVPFRKPKKKNNKNILTKLFNI